MADIVLIGIDVVLRIDGHLRPLSGRIHISGVCSPIVAAGAAERRHR
jgi:hypothetical protein